MRHKYYFSVAAMFKNESWTLKEWVEHYKLHGADHIYLVDDFSDDDYLPILQPYIDSGYVTLFKSDVEERFTGRQIHVTNKYFLPIAKESKWIAQVDVDEFLYSPKVVNIKKILKKYEDYGRVITNWVWFNSNDFIEHPEGGIVNNFNKRAEYNARVWATLYSHANPNGQDEPEWQNLDAPKCIVNTDFGIEQFAVHDAFNSGQTINLSYKTNEEDPELLLNHYQLQSREYWETVKMDRGDCNHWYTGNRRGWHAFYSLDIGDIIDNRLKEQNAGIVL
tara:strand:+ start:279 stop:1112 length:834 start_codon:yes stop_codon:yes gene_type:complete